MQTCGTYSERSHIQWMPCGYGSVSVGDSPFPRCHGYEGVPTSRQTRLFTGEFKNPNGGPTPIVSGSGWKRGMACSWRDYSVQTPVWSRMRSSTQGWLVMSSAAGNQSGLSSPHKRSVMNVKGLQSSQWDCFSEGEGGSALGLVSGQLISQEDVCLQN